MLIRRPDTPDRADWERLYAGYATFYQVTQTPEMRARVWGWIHDHAHEVEAFVAEDDTGRLVGLTHFRPFARPLAASIGGFLDDLFVDPKARAEGVGRALIEAVAGIARERGWSVVRWLTADDNYRARALYDRLAVKTAWNLYELTP